MTNGSDFSTPESEFISLLSCLEHVNPVAGCALKHPEGPLLLMGASFQLPLETSPSYSPAGGKAVRGNLLLQSLQLLAWSWVGMRKKPTGRNYCSKFAIVRAIDKSLPRQGSQHS